MYNSNIAYEDQNKILIWNETKTIKNIFLLEIK